MLLEDTCLLPVTLGQSKQKKKLCVIIYTVDDHLLANKQQLLKWL